MDELPLQIDGIEFAGCYLRACRDEFFDKIVEFVAILLPVVALHGFGQAQAQFSKFAELLAQMHGKSCQYRFGLDRAFVAGNFFVSSTVGFRSRGDTPRSKLLDYFARDTDGALNWLF